MSTVFDPESFAGMSIDQSNDTKFTPVPEGEYPATMKKKEFRPSDKGYLILDLSWAVDDAGAKEVTGMKEPTVRQSIFLDRLENGALDTSKGKNVKLGQLREATGLNVPGQPFNFNMLDGKVARVKVKHRQYEGDTFAEVKEVTKL
jgi:hypothetical protein